MPRMLITGVSSGIGNALARRAVADGWEVVGTVRSETRPEAYGLPSSVGLEPFDAAVPGAARELAERVLERAGCPDVLVNNAGAVLYGPVEEIAPERVRNLFQVNVFSPIELVAALAPAMRERGSGTIVNVTSLGGRMVFPFFTAYNATKHALEGFSEGLWHELKPFGIRVKAVEPGYVETPIYRAMEERERPFGPYAKYLEAMNRFSENVRKRTAPEDAADQIMRAILDESDRLRYPIAAYARPLLAARAVLGAQRVMRFMHSRWMGRDA
ncbi:MAG: SDR family oxidoreductase [Coriobacteriia bacterium]|nr:SDR family oxidoreductase [Coriobacteriia bacterium]